jgi:hypothetical protein
MTDFYNETKEQFENKMIINFNKTTQQANNNNITTNKTTIKIKLFNFLPLLKIKYFNGSIRIKLFNFIPVLKIKTTRQIKL